MTPRIRSVAGGWKRFSRLFFQACPAGFLCVVLSTAHAGIRSPEGKQPAVPTPYQDVFVAGEELTYEVSYLMFKLGTITSRVLAVENKGGKTFYRTEALIRSYKGIPFTRILTIFESTIDERMSSASFGTKEYYKDTLWKYINYTYDRATDRVFISERIGTRKIPQNYDTLSLDGKLWQDGLSLLFLARSRVTEKRSEHVPTLIYRTKADTYIRYGRERSSIEIDAVSYPVDVVKLDGEAGFTGIFGLTGAFQGWFSADNARVPIYAQMRVYIGNVNIELIKWKRPGWSPPKARK